MLFCNSEEPPGSGILGRWGTLGGLKACTGHHCPNAVLAKPPIPAAVSSEPSSCSLSAWSTPCRLTSPPRRSYWWPARMALRGCWTPSPATRLWSPYTAPAHAVEADLPFTRPRLMLAAFTFPSQHRGLFGETSSSHLFSRYSCV